MKKIKLFLLITAAFTTLSFTSCTTQNSNNNPELINPQNTSFYRQFPLQNSTINSIEFSEILSGGVGRDGIPPINKPKYQSIEDSKISPETLGIFVQNNGEKKYFPFHIIVWHEIVNDTIGQEPVSVTFCPLCGSSITFKRTVNNEILDFGVSGYLYQSNLLMYDHQTESFWSQSRGEAVVGSYTGTKLDILDSQILSFQELKTNHQESLVLSEETGHEKPYGIYPYGDYEESDRISFPINNQNTAFHPKEIMYIVPTQTDMRIAIPQKQIKEGQIYKKTAEDLNITIEKTNGQIEVFINEQKSPGYFEMWFSFATQHPENSILIELN